MFNFFDSPELLDVQRTGFYRFLEKGIPKLLAKEFPIKVQNGDYSIELLLKEQDIKLITPESDPRDCILKMKTYSCKLYARVQIVCKKVSSKVIYQGSPEWVFLGSLPMMTKRGHFIINGSPRVIVHQAVRAPGIYFQKLGKKDDQNRARFYGDIIPLKGAWVRLQMTKKGRIEAKFKKGKKVEAFFLQRCLEVIESQSCSSFSFFYPDFKMLTFLQSSLRSVPSLSSFSSRRCAYVGNRICVADANRMGKSPVSGPPFFCFAKKRENLAKNCKKISGCTCFYSQNKKRGSLAQSFLRHHTVLKKGLLPPKSAVFSYDDYSKLLEKKKTRASSKAENDAFVHTYDKLYRTAQDKELEEWQKKKKNQKFFKGSSKRDAPAFPSYSTLQENPRHCPYLPVSFGMQRSTANPSHRQSPEYSYRSKIQPCKYSYIAKARQKSCSAGARVASALVLRSKTKDEKKVEQNLTFSKKIKGVGNVSHSLYKNTEVPRSVTSLGGLNGLADFSKTGFFIEKSKENASQLDLLQNRDDQLYFAEQSKGEGNLFYPAHFSGVTEMDLGDSNLNRFSSQESEFKRKKCSENLFSTFKLKSRYDLGVLGREKMNTKFGWRSHMVSTFDRAKWNLTDSNQIVYSQKNKNDCSVETLKKTNEFEKNKDCNTQLTALDLCSASLWLYKLRRGEKNSDDIDHSQNRRVRTSGELLQTQFEYGIDRLKNSISVKLQEQRNINMLSLNRFLTDNDSSRRSDTGSIMSRSSCCATISSCAPNFRIKRGKKSGVCSAKRKFTKICKKRESKAKGNATRFPLFASQNKKEQKQSYKILLKTLFSRVGKVAKSKHSFFTFSQGVTSYPTKRKKWSFNTIKSSVSKTLLLYGNKRIETLKPCFRSLKKNRLCENFISSPRAFYTSKKVTIAVLLLSPPVRACRATHRRSVNRFTFPFFEQAKEGRCPFLPLPMPRSTQIRSERTAIRKTNSLTRKDVKKPLKIKTAKMRGWSTPGKVPSACSTILSKGRAGESSYKFSVKELFSTKPITGALREFFGTNPLSQYMDQTNPLAEITHKRRISSLGIGGINRESAGMAIRGIHPTHYGRICPIETPEGKNAGLVNSLAFYTKIDQNGFLKTPYYRVFKGQIQSALGFAFCSAKEESVTGLQIAPSDLQKSWNNVLRTRISTLEAVPVRVADNHLDVFKKENPYKVELMAISPIQMISVATSLIPFLEHNDANRALMGSNMQRQAVPLMISERPVVGTGQESNLIVESGHITESQIAGFASHISGNQVVIDKLDLSLQNQISFSSDSACKFTFAPTEHRLLQIFCVDPLPVPIPRANRMCVVSSLRENLLCPYGASKSLCANRRFAKLRENLGAQCPCKSSVRCFAFAKTKEDLQSKGGSASKSRKSKNVRSANPLALAFVLRSKIKGGSARAKFCFAGANLLASANLQIRAEGLHMQSKSVQSNASQQKKIVLQSKQKKPTLLVGEPKNKVKQIFKAITKEVQFSKSTKKPRFLRSTAHSLTTFSRSNQNTCITEKPLVQEFDWVQKGDVLSDCSASNKGELAVGKNVLVAYIPWEGYNFEDAIVISDRLVREHVYTSLHIERYVFQAQEIKDGNEWFTKYLPGVEAKDIQHLEESGLPKIGSFLKEGDILVGKIRYLDKKPSSPYERLLCDILGEKNFAARNKSSYVPKGVEARVIYHKVITVFDQDPASKMSLNPTPFSKPREIANFNIRCVALLERAKHLQIKENSLFYQIPKKSRIADIKKWDLLRITVSLRKTHKIQGIMKNTSFSFSPLFPVFSSPTSLGVDALQRGENPRYARFCSAGANLRFARRFTHALRNFLSERKKNRLGRSSHFGLEHETTQKVAKTVHLFLGERRVIQVGDKISGRHGNKGVISTILPRQDMPYLPDGTPIDIILNPLGVPSRMNVGQVLESLLGLAAFYLNQHFKIAAFDERYGVEASKSVVFLKLYQARLQSGQNWLFQVHFPGKTRLIDGRSGECFDQWVTVGRAYILKLIHMVSEKIHARSTGPYALITQQPLRGRSNKGGQRLGEMEVWALEGFGAAYTLQELLTKKSDDFFGRKQIVDSILPNPSSVLDVLKPNSRVDQNRSVLGHPEIFKVLLCELQSLCLDLGVYILTPDSFQRTFLGVVH